MDSVGSSGGGTLDQLIAGGLPDFLPRQRWFGSKGQRLTSVRLLDAGPLSSGRLDAWLALVEVSFERGPPEIYTVPLTVRHDEVFDALDDRAFCLELLGLLELEATIPTRTGFVRFRRTNAFPALGARPSVRRLSSEQSNTSVVYDEALILKVFRKLEPGPNPDCEVTAFLTTRTRFRNIPLLAGTIEYSGQACPQTTLGMLQQFVSNQGDGWTYTLEHLGQFYDFVGAPADFEHGDPERASQLVREFSAGVFRALRRLGALTGDLHTALASDSQDPDFAPEPIMDEDVDRWSRDISRHVRLALGALRERLKTLPDPLGDRAAAIVANEPGLLTRAVDLEILRRERCVKSRIHGDYHLGQALRTAEDFVIFDFEGEPARPLAERRGKQCPLKDVAGMLRSFDYATEAALRDCTGNDPARRGSLEVWGQTWARIAAETFLEGYLAEAARASVKLVPSSRHALDSALGVYTLDKALYELRYEINNRPAWLPIPLSGLDRILAPGSALSQERQ